MGPTLGASLEYLVSSFEADSIETIHERRRERCAATSADCLFKVNGMVALTKKIFPGGGGGFLLQLRATSALTNMDYLRFGVLCPDATAPLVDALISHRRAVFELDELESDEAIASRDLLDVLSWSRIVEELPASAESRDKSHRQQRGNEPDDGGGGGTRAKRSRSALE